MSNISYNEWISMSDDSIARKIAEFIKYYRMGQNKTQAMLAKDAGISRSTLSLLERGETVTVATLIQVLRVLDQLQVFDGFVIADQPSPILLAKAEKQKRQRIVPSRKKQKDTNEDIDW